MNKWSPERAEVIRQFIDEYFMENRKSPTVRDIAAGTGISKTSVQRYLTDMKEHGEIEYNGRRSIGTNLSRNMFETTPAIRYDSTVSCGLPSEPNVEEADIILPGIIKFYSTKEGREEFLAWKKEREMKLAQEQERHFLERKQENERLLQNDKKNKAS